MIKVKRDLNYITITSKTKIMNTQTQMNTQTTYTVEQVAMMLLNLSGRVDNIEAQLSKKSLNKTTKPKRSAEEIEAEKAKEA